MSSTFEVDHVYLRQMVAAPLTEAMAQLAVAQPEDPVEFLGNYLLKYVANAVEKQQAQQQQQRVGTARTGSDSQAPSFAPPVDSELALLLAQEGNLPVQLQSEVSVARLLQRYAEWLCAALGAEEAYIGRKGVDAAGAPVVHFIASSRGAGSISIDKTVTEEKGVTFDVFKEIEADPAAVDADGNPLSPSLPRFLHVENVLREPRMKFFGVPKLGAYLTRAVQYKSYLHADVANEGNPEEPNALEQWIVISVDTMGQARAFSEHEIDSFRRTTAMFATTLEQLEHELFTKERERQVSTEDAQLRDFQTAFSGQIAEREENLALLLQGVTDEHDRPLEETEQRLAYLTELMVSFLPTLTTASARVVPFKTPALSVFAAALELLGYTRGALLNPVTKAPSWDRLAPLFQEANLSVSLANFPIQNPPVVSTAKQTLGDVSKSDVETTSAIAVCFFQWAQAVIAFREQRDAVEERARQRQLEEEAAVAAGEAAED